MSDIQTARKEITDYCKAMLGDGMVEVELDPIHYKTAIDRALAKYRQRSSNSVEESYCFLTLDTDVNEYTLAPEVTSVREVFRRSIGSRTGGGDGGTLFEPFNLAYTNTYLLSSSNMGGLATYELFAGYQKLVGKMFGSYIMFNFNSTSKKLTIQQRPRGQEILLLWVTNSRPEFTLLQDNFAGLWIKDYSLAQCKMILGEARSKFAQIAGPQGGTQLNGDALKAEGAAAIEKLEQDIINYASGETPMWFVRG
jgi:hypothetical protein